MSKVREMSKNFFGIGSLFESASPTCGRTPASEILNINHYNFWKISTFSPLPCHVILSRTERIRCTIDQLAFGDLSILIGSKYVPQLSDGPCRKNCGL